MFKCIPKFSQAELIIVQ